jgi:hypothetical protein
VDVEGENAQFWRRGGCHDPPSDTWSGTWLYLPLPVPQGYLVRYLLSWGRGTRYITALAVQKARQNSHRKAAARPTGRKNVIGRESDAWKAQGSDTSKQRSERHVGRRVEGQVLLKVQSHANHLQAL